MVRKVAQCSLLSFLSHLQLADMSADENKSQHGCAVVLGAQGVVVLGPSGSGKSRLSHKLVESWNQHRGYARWVADDRILVSQNGSHYIVTSPSNLEGLAERRFRGIESVPYQSRAVVDLVVNLKPRSALDRLPGEQKLQLTPDGPQIPAVTVPEDSISQAIELIEARLAPDSQISGH